MTPCGDWPFCGQLPSGGVRVTAGWRLDLTAADRELIEACQLLATKPTARIPGRNVMDLVAKMAALLDQSPT